MHYPGLETHPQHALGAELAGTSHSHDQMEVIGKAGLLLPDTAAAWRQANNDQRHRLCQLLFTGSRWIQGG